MPVQKSSIQTLQQTFLEFIKERFFAVLQTDTEPKRSAKN